MTVRFCFKITIFRGGVISSVHYNSRLNPFLLTFVFSVLTIIMGKKATGSKRRAIQRGAVAAKEIIEASAKEVEEKHVTSRPTEALFVLDTDAVHIKVEPVVVKTSKQKGLAKLDQVKVQSLVQTKTKEELTQAVARGTLERLRRSKRTIGNCRPGFDLWKEATVVVKKPKVINASGIGMSLAGTAPAHTTKKTMVANKSTFKAVALQVAHSGQSYHPDPTQHQDIIGEALALELRRKEAEEYQATPISAGLSEETKALLLGSDEEGESEEEEDDHDDNDGVTLKKRTEKLTRAQRNKQKRHRSELKQIFERKHAKKLLNSVAELKKFGKDLESKKKTNQEQKEIVKQLKVQTKRILGKDVFQHLSEKDPVNVPTLPVALSSELSSSLRTVRPKGSLVEDRFESFRDRKMADQKQLGNRKKIVQGKKRKVKVKGQVKNRIKTADGGDYLLMG